MIPFWQGTLVISNIILIFLALIYGYLIIEKRKREESGIWIYFIIACALFFLTELVDFLSQLLFINAGMLKAFLQISFGIVMLLAFISKYAMLEQRKH
jgi:hypothetical protein